MPARPARESALAHDASASESSLPRSSSSSSSSPPEEPRDRERARTPAVARRSEARGTDQLFASAMTTFNTHRPPPDTSTRVFHGPRLTRGGSALAPTYLEPGPPGVYHPFASRYFAKLPGVPARCSRKKKTSRGRTSSCASREKWPSLLNARTNARGARWGTARGGGEGGWRTARRRFPPGPRRATRRLAGGGRLDDSAANRRARLHCLPASHWIVIFERRRSAYEIRAPETKER